VPDAAALRAHLTARLPDYMIPALYLPMEKLPLSPNGKVDRLRLPAPHDVAAPATPSAVAEPRSALEQKVAGVWKDLLEVPTLGLDDNFFEVGGHSLLLARMQERLREELGRDVSVLDLFEFTTVRTLAAHLAAGETGSGDAAGEDAPKADEARDGRARGAGRRERMRRRGSPHP
jgi:acyl carrier protein